MTEQLPKPFELSTVALGNCVLTKDLSENDAAGLGTLLAAMEPWLTLGVSSQGLAAYLRREDPALARYTVRLAESDELAGVVCVRYPWLRGPYIELLGLSDSHQGKGVGRRILEWVESEVRHEARNLWVVTSAFNHRAQEFYRRHGFYEIGPLKGLVNRDCDEILFRKDWA